MAVPREEMLFKLIQIYEQAELTMDELPKGLAKDRLRLIVSLAKYLKTALEMERSRTGTDAF